MLKFQKQRADEISSRDEMLKKIESDEKLVIDHARHCLNMDDFKTYRKSFEQLEIEIKRDMEAFPFNDAAHYGMVMKAYMDKLKLLRLLLDLVNVNARVQE